MQKIVMSVFNKVVVGCGHGDAPKYAGEGVASRGQQSEICGQDETPGAILTVNST